MSPEVVAKSTNLSNTTTQNSDIETVCNEEKSVHSVKEKSKKEKNPNVNVQKSEGVVSHATYNPKFKFSPFTLMCYLETESGVKKKVRIFLDNGSNCNLVLRSVANDLGMKGKYVDLKIGVTGGFTNVYKRQKKVTFKLCSLDGKYKTHFPIEACTTPSIAQYCPRITIDPKNYEHLRKVQFTEHLPMSEEYYNMNKVITVLLGEPYVTQLLKYPFHEISNALDDPKVVYTYLGASISADVSENPSNTYLCEDCTESAPDIESFMRLDNLGIEDPATQSELTLNEFRAEVILDKWTTYDKKSKSYTTVLPWKDDPPEETNKAKALATALMQVKKHCSNEEKWNAVSGAYQTMLKDNFFEKVPYAELNKEKGTHYIMTFAVHQPNSLTTPYRVVFAANQKTPIAGKSLNDYLLNGENNLKEIPLLLLKFRLGTYAMTLDLSKMFHRFNLRKEDRDYLRFFWTFDRPESKSEKVKLETYRCTSLPFGIKSSPYICTHILKKHAHKYLNSEKDLAARKILECTYMDDLAMTSDSPEQLNTLAKQVKEIFSEANLPSHKYASNSKDALEGISEELRASKKVISVLGTQWNTENDTLTFKKFEQPKQFCDLLDPDETELRNLVEPCEKDSPLCIYKEDSLEEINFTKRMLASQIAKIYDCSGLIAPFILKAKLMLQETWIEQLDWEDNLTPSLMTEFRKFCKNLPLLNEITINRAIVPPEGKVTEICTFCDGSGKAFSAVVYVVSKDKSGKKFSNLVFSKSKVRPLNKQFSAKEQELSIVRLELLAALIGARCGTYIREAFDKDADIKMRFFSDSQVVLYQMQNDPGGYKVWPGNRLVDIRKLTDVTKEWFYISSEENYAADTASRSAFIDEFIKDERWLHGPPILTEENPNFVTINDIRVSAKNKQLAAQELKVHVPRFNLALVSHKVKVLDVTPEGEKLQVIESPFSGTESEFVKMTDSMKEFYFGNDKSDPPKSGIVTKRSDWNTVLRIMGWILRFVTKTLEAVDLRKNADGNVPNRTVKYRLTCTVEDKDILNHERLSNEECDLAEKHLFRLAQFVGFPSEISDLKAGKQVSKSSTIYKLNPYLSDDKFVRMAAREPGSDHILLPKGNPVTNKICLHIHKFYGHASVPNTLSHLNNKGVHCVGTRQQIRSSILGCSCREPIPLKQTMGKLPSIRYAEPSSHYYVMFDFAGPFWYKSESESEKYSKCWALLATCLYTRAVTIELLISCKTEDLILGLREYITQRGPFKKAFSDNATYFKKTSKEMKEIIKDIDWNNVNTSVCAKVNATWKFEEKATWNFYLPSAPWQGGCIESLVKLTKQALHRCTKTPNTKLLDFKNLHCVFKEIQVIVNSRPLGYVNSVVNPSEQEHSVSPNQLCHGRNFDIVNNEFRFAEEVQGELNKKYRIRSKLLADYWKIWRASYHNLLKFPKKWHTKLDFEVPVGQIVLIKEDNLKKFEYKTGKVLRVIKGRDNLVRAFEIQTPNNKRPIIRHINKVSLMEHDALKLQNDNHSCNSLQGNCVLSSPTLDQLLIAKDKKVGVSKSAYTRL